MDIPNRNGNVLLRCGPAQEPPGAHTNLHRVEVAAIECSARERSLQFSEANTPWQAIPRWVDFLIKCGYICADPASSSRRIGLISMPCESAAAALVALGAIRRRLTLAQANDSALHYQRIERHATGPTNQQVGTFLRHNRHKGRFRLDGRDKNGLIWVRNETGGNSRVFSNHARLTTRFAILPVGACDWYFDGEAPVRTVQGAGLPNIEIYEALVDHGAVVRSNLSQSDSAICLAGRVAGESVSKAAFEAVRFQQNGHSANLTKLLTVQAWSLGTISRVTFFNTRTHELDRNAGLTRLVVADGDTAFLRVLESTEFKAIDVMGVIHRTVERERLEAIGFKVAELQQWYTPDLGIQNCMPPAPPGITILVLRRK